MGERNQVGARREVDSEVERHLRLEYEKRIAIARETAAAAVEAVDQARVFAAQVNATLDRGLARLQHMERWMWRSFGVMSLAMMGSCVFLIKQGRAR